MPTQARAAAAQTPAHPQAAATPPAGWYPNPEGTGQRYWDGTAWTEHFAQPAAQAPASAQPGVGQAAVAQPVAAQPAPVRAPARPAEQPRPLWVAAAALLVMVAGAIGPWATAVGIATTYGIEGDGQIVIGIAVIAAVVLFLYARKPTRARAIWVAVLGALSLLIGIIDFVDINDTGGLIEAAWGIYLMMAASFAVIVAAVLLMLRAGSG